MAPGARVAVTGATGFIGSRLCALLDGAGYTLRLLARNPESARKTFGANAEIVPGDLASTEALGALVSGADAVIHLAGVVRGVRREDFDIPNVGGSQRLLDAMDAAAPGTPLLFFSSLAAREPSLSYYAASKHSAERLLLARAAGRSLTILRPPAVYGPGDREMLPVFRFMAATGLAPCAGSGSAKLSLVFVDDLARAALAWLESPPAGSATYGLHDGHEGGYDWPELCSITGGVCGRTIRVWEIPRRLLDCVAYANDRLSRLLGRAPMLTPGKLRELRHPDWVCDNTAISAALGWRPATGLAAGLRLTPGWHSGRLRP